MPQYRQMMLSLFNRYAGTLPSTTVSGSGSQQRAYATSTTSPTVVPRSSGHEAAEQSEPGFRSRKRRRQSRSFSSTSSSDSASNGSSDGVTGGKPRPQLNFSELSKLIPQQSPDGASSLWYIVATAAILGFHHEPAVGELWHYISSLGGEQSQQLAVARRIREACLKASVLVGFPRGINGLLSLQSSLQKNSADLAQILNSDTSLRAPVPPDEKYRRGKDFFSQIYTQHTDRVLESMGRSSGGDLSYYAVASIYGELMAETSIMNGKETGILEFVCCLADDVAPQAKGHFFGCRNLGASKVEIQGTISLVQEVARQLDLGRVPGSSDQFRFLNKAESW
ncbi:predicted protein [Paecilomyces variotii No. 5]|uniref:Uncharacterized protein n=1 Tax=Byssochlamys spectabilis (strain No. 5 / NBRC 109023) TaxID=1356009 RepID=V5G7S0_BYSSN|nr:predicted protein [Paecilomyces variotii No. 5]